jgi:hypothetical protein
VAETIFLPKFSAIAAVESETISIEHDVEQQLYDFVSAIASQYRSSQPLYRGMY